MLCIRFDFAEAKDIKIHTQEIYSADQLICFHIPCLSEPADIRTDLYSFIIFDSGFQFHHTLPRHSKDDKLLE